MTIRSKPLPVPLQYQGQAVLRIRARKGDDAMLSTVLNIEVYYVDSIESIDGRDSPLYIHVNNIDFKACIRIRHTHKSNNSTHLSQYPSQQSRSTGADFTEDYLQLL